MIVDLELVKLLREAFENILKTKKGIEEKYGSPISELRKKVDNLDVEDFEKYKEITEELSLFDFQINIIKTVLTTTGLQNAIFEGKIDPSVKMLLLHIQEEAQQALGSLKKNAVDVEVPSKDIAKNF